MKRPLFSTETMLVRSGQFAPFAVVGVLSIENGPVPSVLRRALDDIQRQQPLLRARIIHGRGGRAFFELPSEVAPIPLRLVVRQDDQHWRQLAEEALNTTFEIQTAPLLRCTYLCRSDQAGPAELIFTFHHAIMDASSVVAFYHELLSLCAGTAQSGQASGHPLLPASEQLFPPQMRGLRRLGRLLAFMMRQIGDEIKFRRQLGAGRRPPIQPTARCRILTRTLDQPATHALVRQTRRRRVTMYSAVSTAVLLATKKHLYPDEIRSLRAMAFADLRPYLQPAVPSSYLGCYIAMMRHTIDLPPAADFWGSVQAFQAATTQSAHRDEAFAAAILSGPTIQMLIRFQPFRMAATAVSYTGPIQLQPTYGPIRLTGLHGFISNNRLGPEYTAFASMQDGRLVWDFLYLDTDMDQSLAELIAADVNEFLRQAV